MKGCPHIFHYVFAFGSEKIGGEGFQHEGLAGVFLPDLVAGVIKFGSEEECEGVGGIALREEAPWRVL